MSLTSERIICFVLETLFAVSVGHLWLSDICPEFREMGKFSNYLVIYGPRVSTWTHGNHMQKRFAVQSSSIQITRFRELCQGRTSLLVY